MAPIRKGQGRSITLNTQAANNTAGDVVGAVYVYDPNVAGSYDFQTEEISEISVTPSAAFAMAANSFKLVAQKYAAGVAEGSAVTLWDATVLSGSAYVPIAANPVPRIDLEPGESVAFILTKQGAGSAAIPLIAVSLFLGVTGA